MYSIAQNPYNYHDSYNESYYYDDIARNYDLSDSSGNDTLTTYEDRPEPADRPDWFIDIDPDIICDDFKRVELEGTYQTFHVDCQGYDIDGSEIFPQLQWSNCWRYSDESAVMEYYNETIQEYVLTASINNFTHCSKCNWCKKFDYGNLMVSYQSLNPRGKTIHIDFS